MSNKMTLLVLSIIGFFALLWFSRKLPATAYEPPKQTTKSGGGKSPIGSLVNGTVALARDLGWLRPPNFQSSDAATSDYNGIAFAQWSNEYGSGD